MSTGHTKPIRHPADIADQSMNDLVEQWSNRLDAGLPGNLSTARGN